MVKFENFRLDLHDGRIDRHDILFPKPDHAGFCPVVHREQFLYGVQLDTGKTANRTSRLLPCECDPERHPTIALIENNIVNRRLQKRLNMPAQYHTVTRFIAPHIFTDGIIPPASYVRRTKKHSPGTAKT